jgi:SPX domain protein involved in polyphosphate accumulation
MLCALNHIPIYILHHPATKKEEKEKVQIHMTTDTHLQSLYMSISSPTYLPLLHQQQMHSKVRKHNKSAAIYTQTNTIPPQCLHIEAKAAQNSRAGDLDIDAVFMVNEAEVLDLVDNQAFECVVEYR